MNIKNIDAYPNKKPILYCIIFVEIIVVIFVVIIIVNISVEMVICAAVGCESDSRQGKVISFYKFPKKENLKQQWLLKVKRFEKIFFETLKYMCLHKQSQVF